MNILAVDDDRDIRRLLRDLLSEVGHHVVTASDAREAASALRSEPVDVVLLDLMLPGIDGFRFARELSQNWNTRDIPVIVISALEDEESKSCARAFGCVQYLEKPFSTDDLFGALDDVNRGKGEFVPS